VYHEDYREVGGRVVVKEVETQTALNATRRGTNGSVASILQEFNLVETVSTAGSHAVTCSRAGSKLVLAYRLM
jgi:hypothetical protein